MTRYTFSFAALAALGVVAMIGVGPAAVAQEAGQLQQVAAFDHQVTGVTVAKDGRIFVNFPRWTEDAPVSVAELRDGQLRPYPDQDWNNWRNPKKNEMSPTSRWVCVQSVVADGRGNLWVVDAASPAQDRVIAGGPKLVKIDLASDKVAQVIAFDESVAPQGSYLNDARFSPDGRYAYITDSGAKGAIVVVELQGGKARRALDGHPATQPEKTVVVKVEGQQVRRPDGRAPEFAADGIALSPDGAHLYWQALTGRTLYRIETAALQNAAMSPDELGTKVERVGEVGVNDGLWMDGQGRIYLSAVEESAVKVREPDGSIRMLVRDKRLRWPDTFSQGPDGAIYVTASHIPDMSWFKPENGPALKTTLWRFDPRR